MKHFIGIDLVLNHDIESSDIFIFCNYHIFGILDVTSLFPSYNVI